MKRGTIWSVRYAGQTDVGCVRDRNEDYVFTGSLATGFWVFAVADGMGGHESGEVASRLAVSHLVSGLEHEPLQLEHLMGEINTRLVEEGRRLEGGGRMGSTLSVLLLRGGQYWLAHIGDSRIYRLERNPGGRRALRCLTEDHSVVATLLRDGVLTPQQAVNHPGRHVLNQSLGMRPEIKPQVVGPFPLGRREHFLLCSDGLHGVVPEVVLQRLLCSRPPREAVSRMILEARRAGGPDNISAVAVAVRQGRSQVVPSNRRRSRGRVLLLLLLLALLGATLLLLWRNRSEAEPSSGTLPSSLNQMVVWDG